MFSYELSNLFKALKKSWSWYLSRLALEFKPATHYSDFCQNKILDRAGRREVEKSEDITKEYTLYQWIQIPFCIRWFYFERLPDTDIGPSREKVGFVKAMKGESPIVYVSNSYTEQDIGPIFSLIFRQKPTSTALGTMLGPLSCSGKIPKLCGQKSVKKTFGVVRNAEDLVKSVIAFANDG